jgi:hypothetical protein
MSRSFEELCNMKAGEFYWENTQQGSILFMVESLPEIITTSTRQVVWYGVCVDPLFRNVWMGRFLATEKYMHYAPRISNNAEYINVSKLEKYETEPLKKLIMENQDVEYTSKY